MSNRFVTLSRKAGAVLFLALTCSLGCGCLAGDAGDHDEPLVDDAAIDVDDIASPADGDEIHLANAIASLEAQYQQKLDQQSGLVVCDDDGRSSNPEPTPWEPGAQDHPEPTPWIGGAGPNAVNPEPTPWLDPDDDDDDDLKTDAAFTANTSGGSGWSHGAD